jgi:Protein of unknown function (DUF3152)
VPDRRVACRALRRTVVDGLARRRSSGRDRALGAVVFAGAAMLAVLGLPAAAHSVGVLAVSRPLVAGPAAAALTRDAGEAELLPATPPSDGATPTVDPEAPTTADGEAGILRRSVVDTGSGQFDVAAGSVRAPGTGVVHTLRVEVEQGLPVDRDGFADFVLRTLNDSRGWGHDGAMTFARTDGDAPVTLMLASPDTSAALCGDLDTRGVLSCRNGPHVVLTFYRWVNGTDEYADNLTGYRQYLVNHEVGHALGHGHEYCAGTGQPAPVMQQQTLGLKGCEQNSWPYPSPPAPGVS